MVTALARLAERAAEHATLVMAGRSHNVAAQATTMGKRFANAGEELLQALRRVEELLARYPLRGIKGPVGTQQDMLDLLGSAEKVDALEAAVAAPPRLRGHPHQRRPGVPAVARPRRGRRPRAGRRRARPASPPPSA